MKKIVVCFFLVLLNCAPAKTNLQKFTISNAVDVETTLHKDSVFFKIKNKIPIPIHLYSVTKSMDSLIKQRNYSVIKPLDSSLLKFSLSETKNFDFSPINPNVVCDSLPEIHLPFLKDKTYKVLQGYNTNFTHNKLNNRFALDFQMPVGDSICAVADGVVVSLVAAYEFGGKENDFKGTDNFVWIYHQESNLISSYAHLKKEGVLVAIGEKVKANQVIALSGNTGYSSEPHLHFHMLKLDKNKHLESIPYTFKEGYKGFEMKKDAVIIKK